jgi:hypothetical protein
MSGGADPLQRLTDCEIFERALLDALHEQIGPTLRRAVLAEREACAQVAESFDPERKRSNYGQVIARMIRERGDR